jgi:hypothetical protein
MKMVMKMKEEREEDKEKLEQLDVGGPQLDIIDLQSNG